jgi:ferredoxin
MQEQEVYQALTERMGVPESKLLPRIWKLLVAPDEGKILLELPAFAEDLAEKLSKPLEDIQRQLEDWVVKGVVIPFRKEGREKYGLCRSVGNFFESASHVAYEIVGDEDAIVDETGILPDEDIRARIDQAEKIVAVECPCRLSLKKCDHTVECCLLFDRGAELALRRGSGKELTKEQTHELVRSCVKEGLIPSGANRLKITNLCLCCTDCCLTHFPHLSHGHNMLVPSRYLSVSNTDRCNGCQTCVEMCPYEAVDMVRVEGSKKLKAKVDPEKCYGCGVCVPNCPEEALGLKLMRPPEHLPAA